MIGFMCGWREFGMAKLPSLMALSGFGRDRRSERLR
jgi:hypothetical protein